MKHISLRPIQAITFKSAKAVGE